MSSENAPSPVRRHPLVTFVVLAYALTWVFTIPFAYVWRVVLEQQFSPWLLLFLPAPFGPTFAALFLAWKLEGREGVRRLVGRYRVWRVGAWPWLFAVLFPPLLVAAAVWASGAGAEVFTAFNLSGLATIPVLWLLALPFGPLPEELGWRGWLLPRLQSRMSPLAASLVLGPIWTFWHTPMFWFPGAAVPSFLELGAASVLLTLLMLTGEGILFTVLFNRTRGSVLLAIVFHTTFNTAESTLYRLFQAPGEAQEPSIWFWTIGLTWAAAGMALLLPGGRAVTEPL